MIRKIKNTYITILVTVPSEKIAFKISRELVCKKLAACVNIIPKIRSFYTWQNKLCSDKELLLIIKSRNNLFKKVETNIKKIHPYKVPEIIALPIQLGNRTYLDWLNQSLLIN